MEDGAGPWAGARPPRPSSFFCGQVFFEYDPSSATSLLSSVGDHCVGECSEGPSTGALPRAAGSGRPAPAGSCRGGATSHARPDTVRLRICQVTTVGFVWI